MDVNVDSIVDDIYWVSPDTVLRFTTSLARQDTKNNNIRKYFHREVERDSKYSDVSRTISIKREINYYLSLTSITNHDTFTMIRVQDILLLRSQLSIVHQWIVETKQDKKVFAIANDRLIIKRKVRPVQVTGLAQFKSLFFEPVVIRYNEEMFPGVRMTFMPSDVYTDITADKFMGLFYLINTIDMDMRAISMINYLGCPPSGTNLYKMQAGDVEHTIGTGVTNAPHRKVDKVKDQESYFSKMRKLDDM